MDEFAKCALCSYSLSPSVAEDIACGVLEHQIEVAGAYMEDGGLNAKRDVLAPIGVEPVRREVGEVEWLVGDNLCGNEVGVQAIVDLGLERWIKGRVPDFTG